MSGFWRTYSREMGWQALVEKAYGKKCAGNGGELGVIQLRDAAKIGARRTWHGGLSRHRPGNGRMPGR
ncbi:hypothetical protein, partial [Burkholderia pseudomallei]|uniref:hypothetical protein n=1 Tax=Burkholderia pseudomallei TaxID=28450 RepID=UPI001C3E4912